MIVSQFLVDCLDRKLGSFRDFVACTLDDVYSRTGGSEERTLEAYKKLYEHLDMAPGASRFSSWLVHLVGPLPGELSQPDPELVDRIVRATGPELPNKRQPRFSERLAVLACSGWLLWLPLALLCVQFSGIPRLSGVATSFLLLLALYPVQGRLGIRWVSSPWPLLYSPFISGLVLFSTCGGSAALHHFGRTSPEERGFFFDFLTRLDSYLQEVTIVEFLVLNLCCAGFLLLARVLTKSKTWIAPKWTHPITLGLPLFFCAFLTIPLGLLAAAPVLQSEVKERVYEARSRPQERSSRCCWEHDPGYLRHAFLGGYFVEQPEHLSRAEFWLELGQNLFADQDWPSSAAYQENLDFFRLERSRPGKDPLFDGKETFSLAQIEVALRMLQSSAPFTVEDMDWMVKNVGVLPRASATELSRLRTLSLYGLRYIQTVPADWDTAVNESLFQNTRRAFFGEHTLEHYKPNSIWPVRRFSLSLSYAQVHRAWSAEKRYRRLVTASASLPVKTQIQMARDLEYTDGPGYTRLKEEERQRVFHLVALKLYLQEVTRQEQTVPESLDDFPSDLRASIQALGETLEYENGSLLYASPLSHR